MSLSFFDKCPKCGGRFRVSGEDMLCISCGKLVLKELTILRPMPCKDIPVMRSKSDPHPLIVKYFDSIHKLKKENASWASIQRMIKIVEGVNIHIRTLTKYYVRLCSERS